MAFLSTSAVLKSYEETKAGQRRVLAGETTQHRKLQMLQKELECFTGRRKVELFSMGRRLSVKIAAGL